MAIIRGRRPIDNKSKTREENGAIDLALESLDESSQDLLASPSLHSPVNRSLWRVSQTPTCSTSDGRKKRSSYIEKPRVTLKETEERKMTVQEALDSAIQITPASTSSRRRQFLQKQKLYHMEESQDDSLRDANKWNTFHDSGDRIVANVIKARMAAPETPTGCRDSTRTATTQSSSQSTITSFGDHSQLQSPYFRPRQPSNSFLNGSSPSSVLCQQRQRKFPGRSKSVDSMTAKASGNDFPRTKPPISKSTRNLMSFATPEKETRRNGKSNIKKSVDDGLATTSLLLPDRAPSTPQARQSKPPFESAVSIDVSPWLKGCSRDGDGSCSKALSPPIRVPMKETEKVQSPKQTAITKEAQLSSQIDEKPNLEDSLQITYTPDTINRTVEEQRALAKEMADQLSRLPEVSATPEQQKAQSWVVAERESANQHGQRRADFQLERSPSLRSSNSRPRWAARRINSTRSLVHKREHVPVGNVSGHSRGSVSRTRSYSPTSTPSYHSRTDHSNLSGRGGRSISRSPSHSPSEPSQRKKSGRRSAPFRRRSADQSEGINARGALASKYVQAFERRPSRHGEKLEHEMSIHVTERFIVEEGRAVDIEVKSTLKDGKSEQKERTALQRRRLERRQHIVQPGGRREATSQREARTYSRPEKTSQQRHHSHSPTRHASMDSPQHQVSTPQQVDSSIEADDSPTTMISTLSKQTDEDEINENSHRSSSKSTMDDEVYTSVVPEDSNPLNAPDHSSTLFECSLNGNHQVIDLRDWDSSSTSTSTSSSSSSLHSLDSSSHHSTCSVIVSQRKRTVPIDPDGDMCQDSALPPSIRIESSESTIQNHDSSLALDHVIDHMDVVQDLERLARIKAEAAQRQILARQLQAKERLMQVIHGKQPACHSALPARRLNILRQLGQSFQPNSLPPHVLGIFYDFNVTLRRIDEYYESLVDGQQQVTVVEWRKWDSFSPVEKDVFQHRITVLKQQQQVLMQKQQQGEGDGASRGLSWKAIQKTFFQGKRSILALRSRYYCMVKRRSRISYENTTKTTTKQRKSNTSTPAIRSTERTVTKRFYAASFPKRPPARWINTETKILFQHLDSILNNENWEETLGLLPNCTKGDITQRTMV